MKSLSTFLYNSLSNLKNIDYEMKLNTLYASYENENLFLDYVFDADFSIFYNSTDHVDLEFLFPKAFGVHDLHVWSTTFELEDDYEEQLNVEFLKTIELKTEKYFIKGNYFYDRETELPVCAINAEENWPTDGYKYKETEFYKSFPQEEKDLCDGQVRGIVDLMNADYWFCYHYGVTLDGSPYKPIKPLTEYDNYLTILKDKKNLTTNEFYVKYNFEDYPKIFESVHLYATHGPTEKKFNLDYQHEYMIWYFENYDYLKECNEAVNASIPHTNLVYPEPFVASPSNIHHDPFFIHILLYQYWLWFFFISIISFFFLSFAHTVRTNSVHNTPKRETRGVSRARCGDCITFIVPVSWAVSIIVVESTDSADINDGHGNAELVIGVRAYQWGWNYYFPRQPKFLHTDNEDPELLFAGDAIVLKKEPRKLNIDTFWKWSKTANNSSVNFPAHQLLLPIDTHKMVNFMNAEDLGVSNLTESNAFKKIKAYSKKNYFHMFLGCESSLRRFNELKELYIKDESTFDSYFYEVNRQHFMTTPSALLPQNEILVDQKSIDYALKILPTSQPFTVDGLRDEDLDVFKYWDKSTSADSDSTIVKESKFSVKSKYKYLKFDNKLMSYFLSRKEFIDLPILYSDGSSLYLDVLKHDDFDWNTPLSFWDKDIDVRSLLGDDMPFNVFDFDAKLYPVGDKKKSTSLNLKPLDSKKNQTLNLDLSSKSEVTQPDYFDSLLVAATDSLTDTSYISKLFNVSLTEETNHTPFKTSNRNSSSNLYFSGPRNQKTLEPFDILNHAQDLSLDAGLSNQNWDSIWLNSSIEIRFIELLKLELIKKNIYFPLSLDYIDYEFNDNIVSETLEDLFWESGYSAYTHDELNYILDNFMGQKKIKSKLGLEGTRNEIPSITSIISDTALSDIHKLSFDSIKDYQSDSIIHDVSDSYTSAKDPLITLYNISSKNVLSTPIDTNQPQNHTLVSDEYSDDYDDNTWFSNEPWTNIVSSNEVSDDSTETADAFNRAKNTTGLLQNYIAVQKVLKSKFDNGQSNASTNLFFMAYTPKTFINATESPYRNLLFKNFEYYVNTNADKLTTDFVVNKNVSAANPTNTYFLDLPFLLGTVSDSSKFAWFDWFSRWKSYEIQASSIARFSILGVPYFNKNFDFHLDKFNEISDSELYLLRVARARKNYLGSWVNTPYLYNRTMLKAGNCLDFQALNDFSDMKKTYSDLFLVKKFWRNRKFTLLNLSYNVNYTSSGINSPGRFTSKPLYSKNSSHDYDSTILNDILSKRKIMLSDWILARSGSKDYKLLFDLNFLNKSDIELENILRSHRPYKDSLFTNIFYLRNLVVDYEFYFKEGRLIRHVSDYFMPVKTLYRLFLNYHINFVWLFVRSENFSRQQIQLRKGISNMNKLHATNVIALPVDARIRVLACSKDIIHSWAIPAAGIKIDCVPGFTSHRVIKVPMASIYTGQCMEICGRFHHWMPIVVYFVKKDVYYIWLYQAIFRYFDENTPTVVSSNGRKVALVTFARGLWHFEFYNPTTGLLPGDE